MILRVKTCFTCWIAWKNKKWVKLSWNRVKSQKLDEITQNRDFRTDFAIVPKWCAETKFPPMVQLSGAYWLWKCTVTRVALHCLQSSVNKSLKLQITTHKILFLFTTHKILAWYSQIPNRLIPNPLI